MNSVEELCGYYIALLRSAYLIHQQSHWKTAGSNFYGNHLLFQRLYENSGKDADGAAEKMIGVFGDETLDLSMQAQLIGKMMAKYSSSSPLENSLTVEKAILAFSDKIYEALDDAGKLTLGLDNFLQGVADGREEAVYLLKQAMKGGSKTATRKSFLAKHAQQEFSRIKEAPTVDPEADNASVVSYEDKWVEPGPARMPRPKSNYGLQNERDLITRIQVLLGMIYDPKLLGPAGPDGKLGPATIALLKRYQASKALPQTGNLDADTVQHLNTEHPGYSVWPAAPQTKSAANQGDPTQILHQKLLTWLTATVISYVQGQYQDTDITVDVDLKSKKIFGNVRLPKAINPDLQKKIEDGFRTQAMQLLGDTQGFTIGVGFAMFPGNDKTH